MESKEVQRSRKINRICEMVERGSGVVFHNIAALDGNDVSFFDGAGQIEILIENDNMKAGEEIPVTWKYFSDEALDEIVKIIHDSNYGITH